MEPLDIQLAREMLAAIDNGEVRADGSVRPRIGDAKFISANEAASLAQRCIETIETAGFKAYK